MDGNHAYGCTLIGLALTTLLVRLFWMSSPPFSNMTDGKASGWKVVLVVSTVLLMAGGAYLLSIPVDPEVAKRIAEDSYQFH